MDGKIIDKIYFHESYLFHHSIILTVRVITDACEQIRSSEETTWKKY